VDADSSTGAGIIASGFAGFSLLWIPITERILGWLVEDHDRMTQLATHKGTLYIVIVAILF
jgi:hypothetical protein